MKTFVDVIEPTVANPTVDGAPKLDVNFKMGPLDENVHMIENSSSLYVKNADVTVRMTIKGAKKLRKKLKKAITAVELG